ncbi:MAG: hypothetical protein JWO61_338 [Candidatus Saccharibacteria bacterium]|nr:hypothetical protein [Candidatus Saccharibacteria bacterium]
MARVKSTVGTEEELRRELRDLLAARIAADQSNSFALDLRDLSRYVELDDDSRKHMRLNILNGYSGSEAIWEGVKLPTYRYDAMEQDHHIMVTLS